MNIERSIIVCKDCHGLMIEGEDCSRCLRKELRESEKEVDRLRWLIANSCDRILGIVKANI